MKTDCGCLPYWEHLSESEKASVADSAFVMAVGAGELITASDTECTGMVYILRGEIRVSIMSEEGREITLFRVGQGDSCVTTASCVVRQITFDTLVTAVRDTELLVVPAVVFSGLANENIYVKAYMYEKETERFSSAIWVMQQILFKRFDARLAEYLLTEYGKSGDVVIRQTQEEIARNVNSAREVVARMLRQFAADGLLRVGRGSVTLENIEELRKIIG